MLLSIQCKTCNKCMLRETSCEDCQPMNKVFYRNRCVICHFKFALNNICKRYKKIASKENLDKHQSITKISTLIVKFFSMKHCFQKVNADKAKFLFNGKSCRSCTFLFLKEGKTFISSNESGIYELKHKHNNNKMYTVRNYISYSLHHINK